MNDKIGEKGIEKAKPKEKVGANTTTKTTSTPSKSQNLKQLPKDVKQPSQKTGNSKKNEKNKGKDNKSEITSTNKQPDKKSYSDQLSKDADKFDFKQSNVGAIEQYLPDSIKNNKHFQKAMSKVQKNNERAQKINKITDTVKKIQNVVQTIASVVADTWPVILAILIIIFIIIPFILASIIRVGNSPHFYCDLEAPAIVKKSAVYQQYCGTSGGGNDDIAAAAVSLAYYIPALEPGSPEYTYVGSYCSSGVSHTSKDKTNGVAPNDIATQLYVDVHKAVIPGDSYYASCDRSTCTAVRWAGADDDFPAGPCPTIITHLENSDKWEKVGVLGSGITFDDLEGGEVMIKSGHVGIYVGEEKVKEKYPDSPDTTYAGSLGDYCPKLQGESHWLTGEYTVYKNIEPEENSKYKDINF